MISQETSYITVYVIWSMIKHMIEYMRNYMNRIIQQGRGLFEAIASIKPGQKKHKTIAGFDKFR